MATFHSLTPSMGSHQNRLAPDMFSIELELVLPQDHFLPAQNIVAEVWTNILHKLNPDGPEVWTAVPMKLSHVIPGKNIAVFATRFQPTGRGDFGLTARWKAHKDLSEWQWAPTAPIQDGGGGGGQSVYDGDDQKANGDVKVTVRVPRNIAGSSSWTIGPQSVLVYGQDGARVKGYGGAGVGGPGLYLGNHAAATRARISGYESVLSLVGDLLDFDENIPESDKDLHRDVWLEQAKAKEAAISPPKRFSLLSRSSSSILAYGIGEETGGDLYEKNEKSLLSRRSSITDFMVYHEPGSLSDDILAAVVNEPVDPPRLTRKSSVTDMMVPLPNSSTSKRLNRASASMASFASIDEYDQEESGLKDKGQGQGQGRAQEEATPTSVAATTQAPNSASKTSQGHGAAQGVVGSNGTTTSTTAKGSHGKKGSTSSGSTTTPVSKKAQKSAAAAATVATTTTNGDGVSSASALPPVAGGKSAKTASGVSPTVSSLAVQPVPPASGASETKKEGSAPSGLSSSIVSQPLSKKEENEDAPPSSAKIVSGLSHTQGWESQQALSSLSTMRSSASSMSLNGGNDSDAASHGTNEDGTPVEAKKKAAFKHKVISLPPGAHNKISDAILKEAVEFLRAEISQGKKVLVHCRDGHGRSGSVAVAYIAAQLEDQRRNAGRDSKDGVYEEALKEVWKWKCDMYPHKGLRQSLERIQW
ncbi:hypothetical protein BGX28_006855 [Mortierella sp. GBA30]|nr:hypothetical protein BGX28_006855 [Mortierella sp. GBA30]